MNDGKTERKGRPRTKAYRNLGVGSRNRFDPNRRHDGTEVNEGAFDLEHQALPWTWQRDEEIDLPRGIPRKALWDSVASFL